jgi:hypothetical protein
MNSMEKMSGDPARYCETKIAVRRERSCVIHGLVESELVKCSGLQLQSEQVGIAVTPDVKTTHRHPVKNSVVVAGYPSACEARHHE